MKRPPGNASRDRQRDARKTPSEPEHRLWQVLRNRQVCGLKFRRQVWLGPYIVDFLCAEARLVIEIDGETHASPEAQDYDKRRTALIETEGYRVCRFGNDDVMTNIDGVAVAIVAAANEPSPSHASHGPLPLPVGEKGK
jgi:very-short-patch-repair endonuclease